MNKQLIKKETPEKESHTTIQSRVRNYLSS